MLVKIINEMTNRVHEFGYCKILLISPGLTFIVYNFIRGFEGAYNRGKNIFSCLIKIQYNYMYAFLAMSNLELLKALALTT